jgi:hypothetical protein
MMKGGASDVFDGQSIADSHHFMAKDNKPIDGVSIADSSEMVREDEQDDQENKAFAEDGAS